MNVGVDGGKSLSGSNRGVFEDSAGLIVERAVAILTAVSLEYSIAAVLNHRFGPAAWAIDAVAPANLSEQVRGTTLREERLEWNHAFVGRRDRATLACYDFHLLLKTDQQSST